MLASNPGGAHSSLFEALFRIQAPDEAMRAALGLQRDDPAVWHPAERWALAVKLMRERRFPALPADEGNRALGREFCGAWAQTFSGAVLNATLPLFSPDTLFRHWARFVAMGRPDVELEVTRPSATVARITSKDPVSISPYFNMGLFDFVFERLKVPVRFRLEEPSPGVQVMECDWTPTSSGG